jgi:hypothetical protein
LKRVSHLLILICFWLQLSGCAGVPLISMVKLTTLNPNDIIQGDPTSIIFALNVDANIGGTRDKRPALNVESVPNIGGDFERFDRRLDFELSIADPRTLGLEAAVKNRAWLIYRLSPEAVQGVREFQTYIHNVRKRKEKKGGGSLTITLDNDWLAETYPRFHDTQVQIWLQLNGKDRFLEMWSGRLGNSKGI